MAQFEKCSTDSHMNVNSNLIPLRATNDWSHMKSFKDCFRGFCKTKVNRSITLAGSPLSHQLTQGVKTSNATV